MRRITLFVSLALVFAGLIPFHSANAATQLLANGGFEQGTSPWVTSSATGRSIVSTYRPHTGSYSAWLCGVNNCNDQIWQTVTLPSPASTLTITFWVYIDTHDTSPYCNDPFSVRIRNTSGTLLYTVNRLCNYNATSSWVLKSINLNALLSSYAGKQIEIAFQGTTNAVYPTDFFVDDVTLTSGTTATSTPTMIPSATVTNTETATVSPTATAVPPTATNTPVPSGGVEVSTDPFAASAAGQHQSEVEPDTFAYGGKVVSAFQVGRIYDGGSTAAGWSTLSNGSWQHGLLPGITKSETPAGPYDRATDASVSYDSSHSIWLAATLGMMGAAGSAVIVNRSSDGLNWSGPTTVSSAGTTADYDKPWIVCDNTTTSPFYGHCYMEWDDNKNGDRILMSSSINGGLTWSAPVSPAGTPSGLGGQPLVQPGGRVIVPAANGYESAIIAFSSNDGGATWGNVVTVSTIQSHGQAGGLRSGPLPSAEIDGAGTVYLVWGDCRFESGCAANDIVMSTSINGVNWSTISRIPADPVGSGVDHFVPGIAVNPGTSGSSAQLALTYYYYPQSSCTSSTCQLEVGYVSSTNGGSTWSAAQKLAGPASLSWLPATSQGHMVGDYISTSFNGSTPVGVFAVPLAPTGSVLNQGMYAWQPGAGGGALIAGPTGPRTGTTLPFIAADHAAKNKAVKTRK